MSLAIRVFPCIALLALAACGGAGDVERRLQTQVDAVTDRLDAIDQRLAAIDRSLPASDRLRDDLRGLEQRLGAAEAKATQALEAAQTPPARAGRAGRDAAAASPPARRPPGPDPAERRAQLNDLMIQYRRRLAELQAQQGAETPMAARLAARREVRDWYLARRRAIIAGQPLPD